MTVPVTPEYTGTADTHAAPLVDQEYFREDDQAEHGEKHDDQEERHVGALLEDTGVRPTPAGAGSSARAHARGEALQVTILRKMIILAALRNDLITLVSFVRRACAFNWIVR